MTRKEYQQQYYLKHKKQRQEYFKDLYQQQRKSRLQKAQEYYILNSKDILMKLKKRSVELVGHAYDIWKAIKKYAKEWKLPISDWDDFKKWTIDSTAYQEIFDEWKENSFENNFTPVAIRKIKKRGFVIDNLDWARKGVYSWWNEDYLTKLKIEKDLDKQQRERNKSTKEWRAKVKADWEAKRRKK